MRVILFLIGLLFSADGLYYAMVNSMGAGEAIIVAIGIIFILWSSFYDAFKEKGFLKFLKGLFIFGMSALVLYSCFICGFGIMDNSTYDEEYVVVLGAGLNGSEPSLVLRERLEKTVEYLSKNDYATVIVSGGQGKGETISEALAMQNYLVSRGISDDRIILETESASTYENFEFSKPVLDGGVVFITSEFHIARSILMAKLNGIDAAHISASTPITLLPVSCAREAAAQIASIRYYIRSDA
ncbi:MAG: YdcF family protein [Oscillospiraceae bacterium]|nr:YdcF family protein [Oscillospiraceae bacterium]